MHTHRMSHPPPLSPISRRNIFPGAENEPLLKQHGYRRENPFAAIYTASPRLLRGNGKRSAGFKHWVKNRVPSEREQMGVFSPLSPPFLGSVLGIHVSCGFVPGGVMGVTGGREAGPGCWAPGEEGPPCPPVPGPLCLLGWQAPGMSPFL